MNNRYRLTIKQTLDIVSDLPKDWEDKVTKINLKFDADYFIQDEFITVELKDGKILRDIDIDFDSKLLTDVRHDGEELLWYAMDNIVGHLKTPKFCKWQSEIGECELIEDNIEYD